MISFLRIRNFKSIRSAEINCRRINILIGKPNSGKSNILEAIGLLSYIGFGGDAVRYLRTGITRELFYDKDISNEMSIQTDVAEINAVGEGVHVKWHWKVIKPETEESVLSGPDGNPPSPPTGRIGEAFKVFRFYRYFKPGEKSEPIDYLRPPYGSNLLGILYSNSKLRKIVGAFFEEFGYNLIIKPDEKRLEILKIMDGIGVSLGINLVSETLLRMVFNFAVIESNKNAIIALEEPESHAFPFYVKLLAKTIADDKDNQYFISTHNPYFLITILEKAPKNDVNIIVTDYSNYETKVRLVPENKFPEILSKDIDIFFNLDMLFR